MASNMCPTRLRGHVCVSSTHVQKGSKGSSQLRCLALDGRGEHRVVLLTVSSPLRCAPRCTQYSGVDTSVCLERSRGYKHVSDTHAWIRVCVQYSCANTTVRPTRFTCAVLVCALRCLALDGRGEHRVVLLCVQLDPGVGHRKFNSEVPLGHRIFNSQVHLIQKFKFPSTENSI